MSDQFVAEIRIFPFNFAPKGWAFCNGQLLPISQNTALFSLLGTTYGGDGMQTFGLPNFQGRAVMNWGNGTGLSSYDLGETSGTTMVTLTQAQMPMHTHTVSAYVGSPDDQAPTANGWLGERSNPEKLFSDTTTPDSLLAGSFVQPSGGSQAHQNQQPYLALNFVIALYGIFPSRN